MITKIKVKNFKKLDFELDFEDKIFKEYLEKLKMPLATMGKNTYYLLAELSQPDELDAEITEKLDAILDVAQSAEIT